MFFPVLSRDEAIDATRDLDTVRSGMTEDEFRAFYERTARPVWAYLSRISGSRQEADDFLQETYYRFCRAKVEYESESHRRNTLFRIATNVVRDAARRAKHGVDVELQESPDVRAAAADHHTAIRTDLGRAMQRLEPVQREMLWLAYAQGASHEEIAGILGLRAMSIKTLLLRARRKLAGILTEVKP